MAILCWVAKNSLRGTLPTLATLPTLPTIPTLKVHKHEIFFLLFLQKPKPYGPKGL